MKVRCFPLNYPATGQCLCFYPGVPGSPATARCRATSITALSRTRPRPDGVPGLSIGVLLPPRPRLRPDGRSTRSWSAGQGFINEILTRFGRGFFSSGEAFFSRLVTVMTAALPSEDGFAVGGLHPSRARGFPPREGKSEAGRLIHPRFPRPWRGAGGGGGW